MAFLKKNGFSLHYDWIDNQSQKTFLFINSLGTDLRIWESVIEVLGNDTNLLRFDKRGHGLTNLPTYNTTISDYAEDAIWLLNELGIKKCTVIGLSIGGMIAQQMAISYPKYIDKLFLSNSAVKIGSPQTWNERIKLIKELGLESASDNIIERWFSEKFKEENPDEISFYKAMLNKTQDEGYIQACEAIRDTDFTLSVQSIKIPVTCIGGGADISTPPDLVRSTANAINNAPVHIIDGVGHLPCIEVPSQVARLILNFSTH